MVELGGDIISIKNKGRFLEVIIQLEAKKLEDVDKMKEFRLDYATLIQEKKEEKRM